MPKDLRNKYRNKSHSQPGDLKGKLTETNKTMDFTPYSFSLTIALPLMLFFGFHMIFAKTPEKEIFSNYLLSRRLMGIALLLLSANYAVHLVCGIRLKDVNATILMNLSTYFICYWLFSSAMTTLLDNRYITRKRFTQHIYMWLFFIASALTLEVFTDNTTVQSLGRIILALWLVAYGLTLSFRLLKTYRKAVRMFEKTHSDDIESYIRWLSIFTYWALSFGVSCSLLTFLPDEYIFLWVLSSIPFYIYLYCCYQNYILFYEKVENAFNEDFAMDENDIDKKPTEHDAKDIPHHYLEIERRIREWIGREGYRKTGITLNTLSVELRTNRTYLSEYINTTYNKSFRDWITDLRIEYAKQLISHQPQLKIQEISALSGFLSISHFTKSFYKKEGCSPEKWGK